MVQKLANSKENDKIYTVYRTVGKSKRESFLKSSESKVENTRGNSKDRKDIF